METLDDLFSEFGGPAKVGQAIGVSTEHAAAMRRRGSIPVGYWPDLITAASVRAISGVTCSSLTIIHARRQSRGAE